MEDNPFPDYQPKRSPDTIHDYIGTWMMRSRSNKKPSDIFDKIPEAKLENLKKILDLLEKSKKEASKNPGTTVPGNMILGGPAQEYVPSEAELIVSELGLALEAIVKKTPPEKLKAQLKNANIKPVKISFVPITFTHADVMGSGRFFYADKRQEITVKLG